MTEAPEPRPSGPDAPQVGTPEPEAPQPKGAALLRAVEIMDRVRGEGGDAWAALQTHQSLARYLLEETHEVLAVLEDPAGHGPGALPDELGDLLFQLLFHARVGEQDAPETSGFAPFDIDDVARAFIAKMERRNPHLFADDADRVLADTSDVEAIVAQWHAMKAAEGKDTGWFAGIPSQLPSLQTALKVVHRARSAGGLNALLDAAREAAADGGIEGADHALTLLETVVAAEEDDVDPETALRALLRHMRRRLEN